MLVLKGDKIMKMTKQEQIEKLIQRQANLVKLKESYKTRRILKQVQVSINEKKQGMTK